MPTGLAGLASGYVAEEEVVGWPLTLSNIVLMNLLLTMSPDRQLNYQRDLERNGFGDRPQTTTVAGCLAVKHTRSGSRFAKLVAWLDLLCDMESSY